MGVAICMVAAVLAVSTPAYAFGTYPVGAINWLERCGLVGRPGVHVVSHDYVGNYLELRFGDRANAYVDDRPDARTLLDYRAMRRFESGWRAAFDRSDADIVVWEARRRFPKAVAKLPGWKVVARRGQFVVLARDGIADGC
ncbi:MAG: hypothetical protein ACKOYM_10775 [Actinomycetes bacterium]